MGEGISERSDEEQQENNNPMNNPNNLEDQPVGNEIEEGKLPTEEENPTTSTTTASGWVSKPPAHLIEEIGEATLTAAERHYNFALR